MIRLSGIFTLIPAAILLALSFFVLFAADKTASECLKKLGRVVTGLLWVAAALVLLVGVYVLITGHHPLTVILSEVGKACQAAQP
jgi:hypothetical protein